MKLFLFSFVFGVFMTSTSPIERYSYQAFVNGKTLNLVRHYLYKNTMVADDVAATRVEIKLLNRHEITIGDLHKFPSKLIQGQYIIIGNEDADKIQQMSGTLGIVSIKEEAIEVYIKTDKSEAYLNGTYTFQLK